MNTTEFFSAREILALLDAPANLIYPPGGGIEVEKAGFHGGGPTPAVAAANWARKFAAMVLLPRAVAGDDDDTVEFSVDPPRPMDGEDSPAEPG